MRQLKSAALQLLITVRRMDILHSSDAPIAKPHLRRLSWLRHRFAHVQALTPCIRSLAKSCKYVRQLKSAALQLLFAVRRPPYV